MYMRTCGPFRLACRSICCIGIINLSQCRIARRCPEESITVEVYVCVYVCMCRSANTHTHTHTTVCVCVCIIHTYIHTYIHAYIHICTYIHTYIYVYIYADLRRASRHACYVSHALFAKTPQIQKPLLVPGATCAARS